VLFRSVDHSGRRLPSAQVKRSAVPITIAVLAAALVGLLAYGVVGRGNDDTLDAAVAGGLLPEAPGRDIRLPDLDGGRSTSLADLDGRVVVLNFWASWCDPCREEAPVLERAQERLTREGAGTVLGVTYKDSADHSRAFVREHHLSFPSVRDDRLELAPRYGTSALPETFVIDRAGRIVAMSRGQIDQAFIDRAIDRAERSR
jgi:cytochrome c biogenesis protein CcmG/thiol:disulfide interchange protein DsbE